MNGFQLFFTPSGWFLGLGLSQNMFQNLLIYTNNFCFGYIAVSCFFETFPAGWLGGWLGGWVAGLVAGCLAGWLAWWLGGWLVGKSDFNENPVISPDLDLDFGLRQKFNYCQIFTMLMQTFTMCLQPYTSF